MQKSDLPGTSILSGLNMLKVNCRCSDQKRETEIIKQTKKSHCSLLIHTSCTLRKKSLNECGDLPSNGFQWKSCIKITFCQLSTIHHLKYMANSHANVKKLTPHVLSMASPHSTSEGAYMCFRTQYIPAKRIAQVVV